MQFQGIYYSWVQKENICYVKLKQLKFAVNMHVDNYSDYFSFHYNEENGGNSFLNFIIQLCYHIFVSD